MFGLNDVMKLPELLLRSGIKISVVEYVVSKLKFLVENNRLYVV